MTTRASLAQLFGDGASQNITSLSFTFKPGLSAEGILVELIARLLNYASFPLQTESEQTLETEDGRSLTISITFTFLESELFSTGFFNGYRVDRILLGFNYEDQ